MNEFQKALEEAKKRYPNSSRLTSEQVDVMEPPLTKDELGSEFVDDGRLDEVLKERFKDEIPKSMFNACETFSIPKVENVDTSFKGVAIALKPFFRIDLLRQAYSMVSEKQPFLGSKKNVSLVGDKGTGKTTYLIVDILNKVNQGHGLYIGKEQLFKGTKTPVILLKWYKGCTHPLYWQYSEFHKELSPIFEQPFETVYIDDFMQTSIVGQAYQYFFDFIFNQYDMEAKFFLTANAKDSEQYVKLFEGFGGAFFERVGTSKPVLKMFERPSFREV